MADIAKDGRTGLGVATRLLNHLFRGARPLGMSWKEFYESRRAEKNAGAIESHREVAKRLSEYDK